MTATETDPAPDEVLVGEPVEQPEPEPDRLPAIPDRPMPGHSVPLLVGPPDATEWELLERQAAALAKSSLLPKSLTKNKNKEQVEADVLVIALTAREIRIPLMLAVNKINVIEGTPSMAAELMSGLIFRAGHDLRWLRRDRDGASIRYRRKDWPDEEWEEFSFDLEDASLAGLLDVWFERWHQDNGRNQKDTWSVPADLRDLEDITPETLEEWGAPEWVTNQGPGQVKFKDAWWHYRKAMLSWRCLSQAARGTFADVLMGVSLTPEELGADIDPITGELMDEAAPQEVRDDLLRRAQDLPPFYRNQLKSWFSEYQAPAIARLPKRWIDAVEAKIAEFEQWVVEGQTVEEAAAARAEESEDPEESAEAPPGASEEGGEDQEAETAPEASNEGGEEASESPDPPEDAAESDGEAPAGAGEPGNGESAPEGQPAKRLGIVDGQMVVCSPEDDMDDVADLWALDAEALEELAGSTLVDVCRELGLPKSGTKAELAASIVDARPFG